MSLSQIRDACVIVEAYKKAHILFVPVPVLSAADHKTLLGDVDTRLALLQKKSLGGRPQPLFEVGEVEIPLTHDLYKTGDVDAPDAIKNNNGEVVLDLCKRCGRAEAELSDPCELNDSAALERGALRIKQGSYVIIGNEIFGPANKNSYDVYELINAIHEKCPPIFLNKEGFAVRVMSPSKYTKSQQPIRGEVLEQTDAAIFISETLTKMSQRR